MGSAESSKQNGVDVVSEFDFLGGQYKLTRLCSLDAMEKLKDDWQALERRSNEGFDYFQTFDWCYNWFRNFRCKSPGSECSSSLRVYVLWERDEAILLLPFMRTETSIGFSILECLSVPMGQYAGILVDLEKVSLALGKKTMELVKKASQEDAIIFNNLPEVSFLTKVVANDGFRDTTLEVSSILDYDKLKTWDQHPIAESKSRRKQFARRRRKLEAEGPVTLGVHFHHEPEFKQAVSGALHLKRTWLEENGKLSQSLFKDESERFLVDLELTHKRDEKNEGP